MCYIHSYPTRRSSDLFLDIEKHRHSRQAKWIPKVLEFAKHAGEKLLGLGHGLGTDWVQYAQHGAGVIVCNNSPMQDRKSTRLNSSHRCISYDVFCLKK